MQEVDFIRAILMENGASIHTTKLTKAYHAYHGIIKMTWLAHSPNLNLIENVWHLLTKY